MDKMEGFRMQVVKGPLYDELAKFPPDIMYVPKDVDGDPMFMVIFKGQETGKTLALSFCPHGFLGLITNLVASMGPAAGEKFSKPLWVTKIILESILNDWPECAGGDNVRGDNGEPQTPSQKAN